MAKFHRQKAKKLRALLMHILGDKCAWKNKGCKGGLTFDCIVPKGHKHHRKMDTNQRMNFYFHQAAIGNLQILCEKHQAVKSKNDKLVLEDEDPF